MMLDVSDRAECVVAQQILFDSLHLLGQSDEHHESALAVADVVDLPLGDSVNIA